MELIKKDQNLPSFISPFPLRITAERCLSELKFMYSSEANSEIR